jgi:uncharacterized Fe-S cluster-containing protein
MMQSEESDQVGEILRQTEAECFMQAVTGKQ